MEKTEHLLRRRGRQPMRILRPLTSRTALTRRSRIPRVAATLGTLAAGSNNPAVIGSRQDPTFVVTVAGQAIRRSPAPGVHDATPMATAPKHAPGVTSVSRNVARTFVEIAVPLIRTP